MNDSELFDRYVRMNLPTSFRVIGIGEATKDLSSTYKCNFLGADNKQ